MNVYKISIGQYTKKGNWQELSQIFVKTDSNIDHVGKSYKKRYTNFEIRIEEIKEFEEFIDQSTTNPTSTSYIQEEKDIYDCMDYKAFINANDIQLYDEWRNKITDSRACVEKLESEFAQYITNLFNLKKIEKCKMTRYGVEFYFKPNHFQFPCIPAKS